MKFAIWYDNVANVWTIGLARDRGTRQPNNPGAIKSTQSASCPSKIGLRFHWQSHGKWYLAPQNSITIKCLKKIPTPLGL